MAWSPVVAEGEKILVSCSYAFHNGTRFDLLVTDRQVAYSRRMAFAVSDPVETVSLPRDAVQDVELVRKAAWPIWVFGMVLFAIPITFGLLFAFGIFDSFHTALLLPGIAGGALIVSARNRWRLRWTSGGRVHQVIQPMVMNSQLRDQMTQVLQASHRFLS